MGAHFNAGFEGSSWSVKRGFPARVAGLEWEIKAGKEVISGS